MSGHPLELWQLSIADILNVGNFSREFPDKEIQVAIGIYIGEVRGTFAETRSPGAKGGPAIDRDGKGFGLEFKLEFLCPEQSRKKHDEHARLHHFPSAKFISRYLKNRIFASLGSAEGLSRLRFIRKSVSGMKSRPPRPTGMKFTSGLS